MQMIATGHAETENDEKYSDSVQEKNELQDKRKSTTDQQQFVR